MDCRVEPGMTKKIRSTKFLAGARRGRGMLPSGLTLLSTGERRSHTQLPHQREALLDPPEQPVAHHAVGVEDIPRFCRQVSAGAGVGQYSIRNGHSRVPSHGTARFWPSYPGRRGIMKVTVMSTVLIVEDDFAILFVAESTLRIEGYETVAAATRKDALAILRSDQEVDVLLTDIKLRGEKRAGLDLAEKAVELRPDLGVLYTTGGEVRSPRAAGSDFLPKPYTSSQLINAVGHLLEAARDKCLAHASTAEKGQWRILSREGGSYA